MSESRTFGAFIRSKRIALDPYIPSHKMAKLLNISASHMSNIEAGRDAAPQNEVLANLAQILRLNKQEQEHMYDLAAASKNSPAIPADLPEYISTHKYAKIALRAAKDAGATDEEWLEFIERLKKRSEEESL